MVTEKTNRLVDNSRFYILVSSVLISAVVLAWVRLHTVSDQVFYIRVQQLFGLLSIAYWYFALVISPIGYVVGKQRIRQLEFARRAIGVSAFYFALLHSAVALWGQLGGLMQLHYLPAVFIWSLLGGAAALVILMLLAATSFNAVIRVMTRRRWKWLHRLTYLGGILAVLHIWTIGTHLAYTGVQAAALVALIVLAGLELYRTTVLINDAYLHFRKPGALSVFASGWIVASVLILLFPTVVQNYDTRHGGHGGSAHSEEY